jgi:hypothetical protein
MRAKTGAGIRNAIQYARSPPNIKMAKQMVIEE